MELSKAKIDLLSPTPHDVEVQEELENLILETEQWIKASSYLIELSPSAAMREMVGEDQCLCRYELGLLLKKFEMDEEALKYLKLVDG